MKGNKKEYSNIISLLISILFLILGAIMFTNPQAIVIITTYVLGGIFILIGIYKCIKNYLEVKKNNDAKDFDMIVGIILIVLGIVCIFLANVVEAAIRLIIGGWILFSGINSLINSLANKSRSRNFFVSITISILLIIGGLYTILVSNLAFKAIGIVLIIYAILSIIDYIFGRNNYQIKNELSETKVIEAKVIEKDKKTKKKKS